MDSAVWVCVYDSSQGRALLHCKSFLGLNICGFWHSSVTVFNTTYSYPGQFLAKSSEAQFPTERMMLGRTEKSRGEFERFLEKAKRKFREGYHVLYNNCNGFSQECVQFLLQVSLPRYLLTFQYEVLKAPLSPDQKSILLSYLDPPDLPLPDLFPAPKSDKIVTFAQLQTVLASPFAVLVFWTKTDSSYESLNELYNVGKSCRKAEFFWVNADEYPHLAPVQIPVVQITSCVCVIQGRVLASIPGMDTLRVVSWLHPETAQLRMLSVLSPVTYPETALSAAKISLRQYITTHPQAAPRSEHIHLWLTPYGQCLNMLELVKELIAVQTSPVESSVVFHLLSVLVLDPAGVEAISEMWTDLLSRVEEAINRGPDSNTITALRLIVNLYATEQGIKLLSDQVAVIHGFAYQCLRSEHEIISEVSAALYLNLVLLCHAGLDADEFRDSAALLVDIIKRGGKEIRAVYAAQALALLAENYPEIKRFLRKIDFAESGIPLRNPIYSAIQADFASILAI